ncbi:MAG TPA: carboxypeptidase-like regulatory domain-containing protein, partial [Gemmatimonadaceae bacterium]|nr:carboxypeptidase-like regulatory domain-containing protein [Gemmatimonadaceae bacterium]
MLCLLSKAATRATALLVVVLLAIRGTPPLCAQATTVTLHGTITGTDGSVPEGAQVTVRDRETNVARGALADRDGTYRVLGLAPSTYDVTVRAIGYRQQRREAVRLVLGQRAMLDFALERGAVELEPTVVTAGQVFDLHRTDVSTAVLQEEIEKLPLNSRNMLNLAAIAPGVRTYATEAGTSMPSVGSLPGPRFLNFYADGVELKAMFAG